MSRIDSIIKVAEEWLGTTENTDSHREIVDCYNRARYSDAYKMTEYDPWCAAFVVACFEKAGCSDIIPCYASCDQMISMFKQLGRWYPRNSYSPVRGDIIFYEWNDDTISDHTGIVVQNRFGELSVIEGNKSDSVSYRNISSSNRSILGVGRPNYTGDAKKPTENHPYRTLSMSDKGDIIRLPLLYNSSKGMFVRILQLLIKVYFDKNIEVDGEFGKETENAVIAYQISENLEADGTVGQDTWASLLIHK